MHKIRIHEDEIGKLLSQLKINKSCGPDGLHPYFLKTLHEELKTPLIIIFNNTLETGELPDRWKEANISAIYKKGKKDHPLNYRPVSLTSIICKIMEKLIRSEIIRHMRKNKLFSKQQYGFIDKRSTTLQLLKIIDDWTLAVEQGYEINAVYLDFMKAFDQVPHRRLIHKIKSYGIDEQTVNWIENFLNTVYPRV